MKMLSGIAVLALSSAHALAAQAGPPFQSQVVQTFPIEANAAQSARHLRVVLSSDASLADTQVTLGAMTICSKAVCYKPETAVQVDLQDTSRGQGTVVADIDYPGTTVDSIFFESLTSNKRIGGSISLQVPVELKAGYQGAEILIVLSKGTDRGRTTYVPGAVATSLIRGTGSSVYYNPKFATVAQLPLGTTFTVPAEATAVPQIFNIAQHDTGADYPMVDVYPQVDLSADAQVKRHRIVPTSSAVSGEDKTPAPSMASAGIARSLTADSQADVAVTSIRRTGVIEGHSISSNSTSIVKSNATITPNAYANCAANLSAPVNQQVISNALITTGTTYLNWCTAVAPFVHIAVTNMMDSRERFTLPHVYTAVQQSPQYARLLLEPITYWGARTQVLVNGFTWVGDKGTSDGQMGFAQGYEFDTPGWFGDNRVGGGATGWNSVDYSDGNKIVMGYNDANKTIQWGEASAVEVVPISVHHMVSSSTSIMKNGVCGSDTLTNRWSAVGSTPTGRLVFISSTSDGQTSAAELCGIFRALGANWALRLDGGPSAAMTIDGKLLNPLTGLSSIMYGTSRHIAYPLKIAYQGV